MKNVILLNNRSLNYYDFKELKDKYDLRISAVIFESSLKALPNNVKKSLDKLYVLPDPADQQNFPPFPEDLLTPIIEEDLSKFKNTWIIGTDEINNLPAASLREKYGLKGTSYSIISNYRNKVIQKNSLSRAELRVPNFFPINLKNKMDYKNIYKAIQEKLGLPFIMKPVDRFISIGVEKIDNYDKFFMYFKKFSNFSNFVAEEFINGELYHCDFIIQHDNYIFFEVSEYLYNGLSFLNGYNHGSLLVTPDNPLHSSIVQFCKKANSILGLKSGCGHFEIFVTKEGELIFLEAAARPAGSIVPLIFTKTFGKNYLNAALLAEIEENPGVFKNPSKYYFWSFFPKKPGIVKSFRPILIKSPYNLKWLVNLGDTLYKPSSIAEKSGVLLVSNSNYEILRSDFYSLRNFESIEVEES